MKPASKLCLSCRTWFYPKPATRQVYCSRLCKKTAARRKQVTERKKP